MTANKPVHEIRLGRVRVAVWENQSVAGPFHSVTLSRLYKDEAGKWADSASFDRDDLPLLAKLADQAHTWIYEQRAATKATVGEETPLSSAAR